MESGFLNSTSFWDVDIEKLDVCKHQSFIIARVLEHGTLEGIRSLLSFYGLETIRQVIKTSNLLTRRTAVFWSSILLIPPEEVSACSSQPRYLRKR